MVQSDPKESRPKNPEVTAKGYSVFDGTMADMTYVQIEEAARRRCDHTVACRGDRGARSAPSSGRGCVRGLSQYTNG